MMKEILDSQISVRVMTQGSIQVEPKTIKQVILEPEGIHLDDIVYALQQVVAGIIKQKESKESI
jgi:ribosomal protein L12E/L44/L45/RPP1/RPP2